MHDRKEMLYKIMNNSGENSMRLAEEAAIQFLLREADIAVKYCVMSELCNDINFTDYNKLKRELENSERAQHLLECLKRRKEYHGATLQAAENSLNMLIDMGFTYNEGFSEFDKIVNELVQEVKYRKIEGNHVLRYLPDIVIIPFLLRTGVREAWMIEFVKERIDMIYDFVRKKCYHIYDLENKYKGMPPSFRNRPVIRPELYKNGEIKLPLEYDIYGLACLYSELSKEYRSKIDKILAYIMNTEFQQIENGYGVLHDNNRYWALGWDPKPTDLNREYSHNPLLLKMELLSRFAIVREANWFSEALKIVGAYKDCNELYYYPKNYLTEKNSCWILGHHMGLGENRRRKDSLVIEGTFRTLKILKNFS